jgi:hypothetical protein
MRILGPVFESSLEGTLTSAGFREMARARFVFPHYLLELAKRVRHSALKQYLGEKVRLLDPNSKAAKAFLWGLPQVNAVRGKGNVRPILIFTFGVVADDEFLEQLRKTQPGARWADRPFTGHDKPYDLTVLFKNPTHKGMALDEVDRCLASHDVIVHQVAAKLTYFEFALLKAGRARGVDMVLFHRRQIEARPDELPPRPMVNLAERLATAGDRHFCVTANPLDDEQATSALTPLLHWLVAAA